MSSTKKMRVQLGYDPRNVLFQPNRKKPRATSLENNSEQFHCFHWLLNILSAVLTFIYCRILKLSSAPTAAIGDDDSISVPIFTI